MIVIGVKNSISYMRGQGQAKSSSSRIADYSKTTEHKNLFNIVPHYTKINFHGKTPLALSEIPVLDYENICKLVNKIKKLKRKPLIFSDYDGTHTDFAYTRMSANPTARPHIGEEGFMKLCATMEASGIPFVILTTRSFEKLGDSNLLGKKITELLNVVGLNGNQMRLNLPQNKKTQAFIDKWAAKSDYKTSVKKIHNNKVRIEIDPIVPQELHRISEKFNSDLKPLGFELNNESIISYFKWNKLFQETKETTTESPHVINVNNNIFTDLNRWLQRGQGNTDTRTILVKTPNGKVSSLSYGELADYGLNKFKQICDNEYGNKLSYKKVSELSNVEKKEIKALGSTHKDKRFYEVADIRAKINDKGTSCDFLSDVLVEEEEKPFPIVLGDSVSAHNDDEFAMKKISDLKGAGIAILKGNSKDDLNERLKLTTHADYKLESFADTAPFLHDFVQLFIK